MNPYVVWFLILIAVFPLTGFLLVTVGQPVRPLGHLLKASGFWTLVVWVVLAAVFVWGAAQ
jgi:hypothetical protein